MLSRPRLGPALVVGVALAALVLPAASAQGHGFTSTVYVDVTDDPAGRVTATVDLEYDLLMYSAGVLANGDILLDTPGQQSDLDHFQDEVVDYVTQRFTVSAGGEECSAQVDGHGVVHNRDVPYATFTFDYDCPGEGVHSIHSGLFPDEEGYVVGTTTIVQYELDGKVGSAALTGGKSTVSTTAPWNSRLGEFFLLGSEHLLTGLDHILFLLALIVGSRRLRDIVLAATSFTLAHSVTFLLAGLQIVGVSGTFVEPVIALSIAAVAAGHLWTLRSPAPLTGAVESRRALALAPADWTRLGIVFCFGLVHGLGFAGALGLDESFSWGLLIDLLVFNVGIEVVQLGIIAVVYPPLALLRRRNAAVGRWVTGVVAAGVTGTGLFWFIQRVLGLG